MEQETQQNSIPPQPNLQPNFNNNSSKLFIALGIFLFFLLVVGIVGGWYYFKNLGGSRSEEINNTQEVATPTSQLKAQPQRFESKLEKEDWTSVWLGSFFFKYPQDVFGTQVLPSEGKIVYYAKEFKSHLDFRRFLLGNVFNEAEINPIDYFWLIVLYSDPSETTKNAEEYLRSSLSLTPEDKLDILEIQGDEEKTLYKAVYVLEEIFYQYIVVVGKKVSSSINSTSGDIILGAMQLQFLGKDSFNKNKYLLDEIVSTISIF